MWKHAPRVQLDAKVEEAEAALTDAVHEAFMDSECPREMIQALSDTLDVLRKTRDMIPRVGL